jgi:VCBS repeat-containing protein
VGPQGPTGPPGAAGATGATGPVDNSGTLTLNLPILGAGGTTIKAGTAAQLVPTLPADATKFLDGTGAFTVPGGPYDVAGGLPGLPGAGATVLIFTAVRAVAFPANFSGSRGSVGVNPTATAAYTIKNGSTTIGTISISTGGAFTFTTTSGTSKSLAAGDRLTVIAPGSQDATLSDVSFTLAGTR